MLTEEFNAEICKFKETYKRTYMMLCKNTPNFMTGLENLFVVLDAKYYDMKNQLQQSQITTSKYKAQIEQLQKQLEQARKNAIDEYPKLIARKVRAEHHVRLKTDNEAKVFYWIQNSPEPLIVNELAKHCGIPITTCHGVINTLELKRLIRTKKHGRSKKCYPLHPRKDENTSEDTTAPILEKNDETYTRGGVP